MPYKDLYIRRAKAKEYSRKQYQQTQYRDHLKAKYGLTLEAYQTLLEIQNFKCAICKVEEKDLTRRLDVDHDHKTQRVRGLLCSRCNTVIGLVNEDNAILHGMRQYLNQGII